MISCTHLLTQNMICVNLFKIRSVAQTIELHIDTQTGRLKKQLLCVQDTQKRIFRRKYFWTITIPSLYTIVYMRKLHESVRVVENDNKQYCKVWWIHVKCVGCIQSPGGARRQPWLSPTVSQCQLIVSEFWKFLGSRRISLHRLPY